MATPITASISNNADDTVQKSNGASSTSTNDLNFGPNKGYQHCGLRFRDDIDDLSSSAITITAATLTFRATASDVGSFTGRMFIEDNATPAVYDGSSDDITDRPVIQPGIPVSGTILGSSTSGQDFTLDITALVQQLVDDGTIASSQISFLYIHSSGNGQRVFESLDAAGGNPVDLSIAYTSAGNATFAAIEAKNVTITNPSTAMTASSNFVAKEAITVLITGAIAPNAEITSATSQEIIAKAALTVSAAAPKAVITTNADFAAKEAITVLSGVTAPNAVIFDGVLDFGDFGNIERTIDISEYETGTVFYLEVTMKTENVAFPAKAHLFNVTSSLEVVGSEVTTTSTSPITVRGSLFGLTGSNKYRVRLGGEAGTIYTMYAASVLVDWTRV